MLEVAFEHLQRPSVFAGLLVYFLSLDIICPSKEMRRIVFISLDVEVGEDLNHGFCLIALSKLQVYG